MIFMNPFFKLKIILFFIHHQATAVYQAKEKLKSIEKARKGIIVLKLWPYFLLNKSHLTWL